MINSRELDVVSNKNLNKAEWELDKFKEFAERCSLDIVTHSIENGYRSAGHSLSI